MPVIGMGGLFFRAKDPDALSAWYRENLNVGAGCSGTDTGPADEWSWNIQGGPMVFAPFKADTDYFAPSTENFMFNLMVDDLDAILARAKAEGVEPVKMFPDEANGRFAHIIDPEGRKVELWQPKPMS